MKPECELCREEGGGEGSISDVLGENMRDQLLYRLFNPKGSGSSTGQQMDINQLIQKHLSDENGDNFTPMDDMDDYAQSWLHRPDSGWMKEYVKQRKAKEKAWKDLLEKIKKGEINLSEVPADQLIQNFLSLIIEGLIEEGLLDLKRYRHWMYPNIYIGYPEFTNNSERIIAKKVLEEVFMKLQKEGFGPHEVPQTGIGHSPSHILREYDEHQHHYDMLDVQETLISTSIRDPVSMDLAEADFKARIPIHKAKSANAIIIDSSYSMRGDKFKGAIMAALAFKELITSEYREDSLQIIAYNQNPFPLQGGQIIRLRPYGYTDIGQALDLAVEGLLKEDGNRNVFLITDGEPTASCYRDQTPEESAMRAAYTAGKEDVNINIIMLDHRPELKRICEKMAKLNGNAIVTYVADPLNLKDFVVRAFINMKRSSRPRREVTSF